MGVRLSVVTAESRPVGAYRWRCGRSDHCLPDLQLSFRAADRSPVLAAFLDVVRTNCQEVGSRLDEVLAHHPAACLATQERRRSPIS